MAEAKQLKAILAVAGYKNRKDGYVQYLLTESEYAKLRTDRLERIKKNSTVYVVWLKLETETTLYSIESSPEEAENRKVDAIREYNDAEDAWVEKRVAGSPR